MPNAVRVERLNQSDVEKRGLSSTSRTLTFGVSVTFDTDMQVSRSYQSARISGEFQSVTEHS